jgi:hypothetical protein
MMTSIECPHERRERRIRKRWVTRWRGRHAWRWTPIRQPLLGTLWGACSQEDFPFWRNAALERQAERAWARQPRRGFTAAEIHNIASAALEIYFGRDDLDVFDKPLLKYALMSGASQPVHPRSGRRRS